MGDQEKLRAATDGGGGVDRSSLSVVREISKPNKAIVEWLNRPITNN
jgi:hypothetical protein